MKFRILILSLLLLYVLQGNAQSATEHYYVTIGVFAKHENAIRFTDNANKLNFSAQYAIHPEQKRYYVYLLDTDDKRKAYAFLIKIRVETEFKTAWIYTGKLGDEPVQEVVKKEPEPKPAVEEPIVEEPKMPEPVKDSVIEPPVAKIDSSALTKKLPAKKPEGKPYFFKLIDGSSGAEVMGEVHLYTAPNAAQYQSFPVNQIVYIKVPPTGVLQATTVAAGYREMKRPVNFNDPATSAAEVGAQQEAIISFPLVKVKMGDYIEFTHVRFITNSSLLQPESKNELDGLADLMKENKKYKVKIHGHCNGKEARDIVSKGTSPDFFATNNANVRENASAKRLTELRAELVKEYLVSQGVEPDRITTKGEGGSTMIYPQNSTLSSRNDRVEIEVSKGR